MSSVDWRTYTAANTVTWIAGSDDWSTAADWSGGSLPGSSDDVVIPVGVTVTHSTGTDTSHRLSDLGTLTVSGGTLSVDATGALVNLTQSGGTLNGTGALTVSGTWTWTGGTLSGSGTTTLASGGTGAFDASGGTLTLGRNVSNNGNVTWTDDGTLAFSGGAVWSNAGTFTTSNFMGMSGQSVTGTGTFANSGTFTANNSHGTSFASGVSFNNTGTVDVTSGTLSLAAGTSSGTIAVSSATTLKLSGYVLSSSSTVTCSGSGDVEFSGGTSTLGGTVSLSTGNVTIDSGATVSTLGATVSGDLTNNGTLSVGGASVATLTISGFLSLGMGSTLNMVIAGTSQFSHLNAGSVVDLGGTLNISYLGGFTPSTGNSFALLTGSSILGTFSSITGTSMTAHYNSTDFTLTAWLTPSDRPEESEPEVPDVPEERPVLVQRARDSEVLPVASVSPWLSAAEPVALTPHQAERAADVLFAEGTADEGEAWLSAALAWDDLLTLPLRLLAEVVQQVV